MIEISEKSNDESRGTASNMDYESRRLSVNDVDDEPVLHF